jgi:hypothetical protein
MLLKFLSGLLVIILANSIYAVIGYLHLFEKITEYFKIDLSSSLIVPLDFIFVFFMFFIPSLSISLFSKLRQSEISAPVIYLLQLFIFNSKDYAQFNLTDLAFNLLPLTILFTTPVAIRSILKRTSHTT